MSGMAGGMSDVLDPTPEIIELATTIKPTLLRTTDVTEFPKYDVLQFKQQVVAGMVYLMNIQVSNVDCLHVKVYVPLPHEQQPPQVMVCDKKSIGDTF